MKIAIQILKEFWFPVLIAVGWTSYNLSARSTGQWTFRDFMNTFGPTFFFASWLVSQWYRIRKQQRVEDGLVGIGAQVKRMLDELETKTNDLVGHITGGDSVCYLANVHVSPSQIAQLVLVHRGKHALQNIRARMVDLDVLEGFKSNLTLENIQKADTHLQLGDLSPGLTALNIGTIDLGLGNKRQFDIFFTTRGSSFTQLLRFRKINDIWVFATKIDHGETHFEQVQNGFPLNQSGQVDWGYIETC